MLALAAALAAFPALAPQETPFTGSECFPPFGAVTSDIRLTSGDLDGDGNVDVLMNEGSSAQWIQGTPDGLGTSWTVIPFTTGNAGPAAIVPSSAANGHSAVLARRSQGTTTLERILIDATGSPSVGTPLAALPGFIEGFVLADWNGDGLDDLIVVGTDSPQRVTVFNVDPAGGFDPPVTLDYVGERILRPIAVDMDGDGDLDLAGGSSGLEGILILENRGTTTLERIEIDGFGPIGTAIRRRAYVRALDVDEDGLDDLIFFASYGFTDQGAFGWRRALGGGSFGPVTAIPAPVGEKPYSECFEFGVADLDGDGRDDWFLTQTNEQLFFGGQLKVGLNRGGGVFSVTNDTDFNGTLSLMQDAQVLDIDRDGDLDIMGLNTCDPVNGGPFNCAVNGRSPLIGTEYCAPAIPNASGQPGTLVALGSRVAAQNTLTLRAGSLPAGVFGILIASRSQDDVFPVVNSSGRLCVGGASPIARFVRPGEIKDSGPQGTFDVPVDLERLPAPLLAPVAPGDTLNFQVWHRDAPSVPASNFTSAVAVTFV